MNEDDSRKDLPEEIQLQILKFTKEHFLPALLKYLTEKNSAFEGINLKFTSLWEIATWTYDLDLVFQREQHYDIMKIESILSMPMSCCEIEEATEFVGAAVRICKAMKNQEYADGFSEIVKGYFTPAEKPNPNDYWLRMITNKESLDYCRIPSFTDLDDEIVPQNEEQKYCKIYCWNLQSTVLICFSMQSFTRIDD